MYAREVRIQNRSGQRKRFLITRRECEPSAVREIHDDSGPIVWNAVNGHVHFEIEVNSGESRTIGIKYHKLAENGCNGDTLRYRFNAMLRRYLCEIRDNYVTPARLRLAALQRVTDADGRERRS
jgi:hypothetical protein